MKRPMKGPDETTGIIVMLVVVCLLVGMILRVTAAFGHEGDDALAAWYRTLTAPNGASCCSMLDCSPTEARIRDGQWEVVDPTRIITTLPPQKVWLPVPPEAVLRTTNPDGRPVACIVGGVVKCFVPPSSS